MPDLFNKGKEAAISFNNTGKTFSFCDKRQ